VLWGADGNAWLIDPAAHGGHSEADLAMMHLFDGFPAATFAAYDEASPPLPGRDDRVALHQLAPLLVHACLFGGSYGDEVDQIARRYA
jgi:fructosamine-3-kinase